MSGGEERRAVRIALAMALAICLAEIDPERVQLSFLAPLAAAAMTTGARVPAAALLLMPALLWAMCVGASFALQLLQGMPVALGVLLFGAFLAGFRASAQPRLAIPGLLMLIVGAIVPSVLVTAPALADDLAGWMAANAAIAAVSVLFARLLLPEAAGEAGTVQRIAPIGSGAAAGALLFAVFLVALVRPEAKGAFLISVVVALRADVLPPAEVIRTRLGAALVGGSAAWLAWQAIGLAPSLPVLFVLVLLVSWLLARRFVAGGPHAGVFLKSLNAFAILLGEGFSVFFEEADERFGIRVGAVVLGLLYASVVLWMLRPRSRVVASSTASSLPSSARVARPGG